MRLFAQKYEGDLDIWIAVAPSNDATEWLVADLAREHVVHSVRNIAGTTLRAERRFHGGGEVIVR